MNGSDVVFLIGGGVIFAAVVYIFCPAWLQRLPAKRKRVKVPDCVPAEWVAEFREQSGDR